MAEEERSCSRYIYAARHDGARRRFTGQRDEPGSFIAAIVIKILRR